MDPKFIIAIAIIFIVIIVSAGLYQFISKNRLIKTSMNIKPGINISKGFNEKEEFIDGKIVETKKIT